MHDLGPLCGIRGVVKAPWGIDGTLIPAGSVTIAIGEKTAKADNAGAYEIGGLTAGVYDIIVRNALPQLSPWEQAKSPNSAFGASPQTVTVAAGETKVVDICLEWLKASVIGYVYDEMYRKPIAGATVSGVVQCMNVPPKKGIPNYVCMNIPEITTEIGLFFFGHAIAGDQLIHVTAPGYIQETRDFKANQNETTTLEFYLKNDTLQTTVVKPELPGTVKVCVVCGNEILPGEKTNEEEDGTTTHYSCWQNSPTCQKCHNKILNRGGAVVIKRDWPLKPATYHPVCWKEIQDFLNTHERDMGPNGPRWRRKPAGGF